MYNKPDFNVKIPKLEHQHWNESSGKEHIVYGLLIIAITITYISLH